MFSNDLKIKKISSLAALGIERMMQTFTQIYIYFIVYNA